MRDALRRPGSLLAMTDGSHDHGRFTIEPDSIPPGVRCGACHRLVLPTAVLIDGGGRSGDGSPDQSALAVRCPRCGVAGTVEPGGRPISGSTDQVVDVLRRRAVEAAAASGPAARR